MTPSRYTHIRLKVCCLLPKEAPGCLSVKVLQVHLRLFECKGFTYS